jgi:hypothetical protein
MAREQMTADKTPAKIGRVMKNFVYISSASVALRLCRDDHHGQPGWSVAA